MLATNDKFAQLQSLVNRYLKKNGHPELEIHSHELRQLSYFMGTEFQSPEAQLKESDELAFEAQRAVIRLYALQLLTLGDEEAYQQFVMGQPKEKRLSFEQFSACSTFIDKLLERSSQDVNMVKVLRATCFIAGSQPSNQYFQERRDLTLPRDSEQIITAMIDALIENPADCNLLLPAAERLTPSELQLLRHCYWPLTHMRWMMFAEGGMSLTANVSAEFDSSLWQARWLLNLSGMSAGPGAQYLTQPIYLAYQRIATTLEDAQQKEQLDTFLPEYLKSLSQDSGSLLLGYIMANLIHLEPLVPDNGLEIATAALQQLEAKSPEKFAAFQASYADFVRDPEAKTPTYVPGLLKNAFQALKSIADTPEQALEDAILFTLQCRAKIAEQQPNVATALSAGSQANSPTLQAQLKLWLETDKSPDVFEVIATEKYGQQVVLSNERCQALLTPAVSSLNL